MHLFLILHNKNVVSDRIYLKIYRKKILKILQITVIYYLLDLDVCQLRSRSRPKLLYNNFIIIIRNEIIISNKSDVLISQDSKKKGSVDSILLS